MRVALCIILEVCERSAEGRVVGVVAARDDVVHGVASATGDVPAAAALPHPTTGVAAVPSIAASGVSVPDGAASCSPSQQLMTAWAAPVAEKSPSRLYDEVEYF